MTDHTPTTDEVREKYAFQVLTTSDSATREANRAEFDRWLKEYTESIVKPLGLPEEQGTIPVWVEEWFRQYVNDQFAKESRTLRKEMVAILTNYVGT